MTVTCAQIHSCGIDGRHPLIPRRRTDGGSPGPAADQAGERVATFLHADIFAGHR